MPERAEPDDTGGERVRAARVVFGAEPFDAELYGYLRRAGRELLERAAANPAVTGVRARRATARRARTERKRGR